MGATSKKAQEKLMRPPGELTGVKMRGPTRPASCLMGHSSASSHATKTKMMQTFSGPFLGHPSIDWQDARERDHKTKRRTAKKTRHSLDPVKLKPIGAHLFLLSSFSLLLLPSLALIVCSFVGLNSAVEPLEHHHRSHHQFGASRRSQLIANLKPQESASSIVQEGHQLVINKPHGPPLNLAMQASPAPADHELPEFLEPIQNQTVALGRDAQFSCKIRNLNNYRSAWLRVEDKGILGIQGNTIIRNYRIKLIHESSQATDNFVLTIKDVKPSDKGGYMCQVNTIPMRFITAYLDVLTPPSFTNQLPVLTETRTEGQESDEPAQEDGPSDLVTVQEGANITLQCNASGHPEPVITWRREDQTPIILDGRQPEDGVVKAEGTSLALSQVSRLSAGAYLCIANNGVQPSASRRQVLELHFKPVIRLPQKEVAGWPGQAEVRLVCYVELLPTGSYHWLKIPASAVDDDVPSRSAPMDELATIEHDELTNSDKFEIQNKPEAQQQQQGTGQLVRMSLLIRRLDKRDFGSYKCLARNSMGHQSNSIRLNQVTAPAAPPAQGTAPSSGFSLGSIFRTGSASGTSPPTTEIPDESTTGQGAGQGTRQRPSLSSSRNHPRSWNQPRSSQPRQNGAGTTEPINAGQSSGTESRISPSKSCTIILIITLAIAHQLARPFNYKDL